ncbi:MAG: phosphatidylglycerol lysyltransferase domain-containing protein [Spirochaetes bacterium]|nr:phosphatidylglycerol lysyltransferase domain-containing protein [Spirochaetota bacterium]
MDKIFRNDKMYPKFPEFKPIELDDRGYITEIFSGYQPENSEYTFTNLFIWRNYYGIKWSVYKDHLFIVCRDEKRGNCAWQPVGPGPRAESARVLLEWMGDGGHSGQPYMIRADNRLIREIDGRGEFQHTPDRDNFDYVYKTGDLIDLYGKKYHSKRNHINKFLKSHSYVYSEINDDYILRCRKLIEEWCAEHRCKEDMNLMAEWDAVNEALQNFNQLRIRGAVILVDGAVHAFTLGEMLNSETAVVHIEKASPKYPALYSVVNQQFCENIWHGVPYINREQDLGVDGLRKAKLSYHPSHLVEKFQVTLTGSSR